jgi:hypothetical protein
MDGHRGFGISWAAPLVIELIDRNTNEKEQKSNFGNGTKLRETPRFD